MSTSFIAVVHILAGIQEGLKLVLAVAFIFQDCVERLNMGVYSPYSGRFTLMEESPYL
jgi:hypothetical protein